MNKIVYEGNVFTDSDILSASVTLSNAMISEELPADELKFTVHVEDSGYLYTVLQEMYKTVDNEGYLVAGNRIDSFVYGTPVKYYKDDKLQGTFYLSEGKRIGRELYEFKCVSAIGLLIKIPHVGGVYDVAKKSDGKVIAYRLHEL